LERKKLFYGESFERAVLHLIMEDYIFCVKSAQYLKAKDFGDPRDWIFSQIVDFYDRFSRAPTWEEMEVAVGRQESSHHIQYYTEISTIKNVKVDPILVKEEITGFIRMNLFTQTAYRVTALFNNNKKEEAYAVLKDEAINLNTISFDEEKFTRFGDAEALLEQMYEDGLNAIPTGIKAIDDSMGGGMLPGTWTTWLGGSNVGKSMVIPNIIKAAAAKGKKTFVTVHEDELPQTKARYLACFSEIPYNKLAFAKNLLTEDEKRRLKVADELLKEYVTIQFMYGADSTVENVCRTVKHMKKIWPFDLYVCDYGQCLTSTMFRDLSNQRIIQEHVYSQLKQLCLTEKIAGTGGAQINREAMNKNKAGGELVRMTDVSDCIGIIKKSSTVITMNRSDKEIDNKEIIFLLDKSRGGLTNIAVKCKTDYEKCITHFEYKEEGGVATQVILDTKTGVASIRGNRSDSGDRESHG
jgi:replicative DNA helicase